MSTNEPTISKSEAPNPKAETSTKTDSVHSFTPRETNKNQPNEIAQTVYGHMTKLHSLATDWEKNRDKGYRLARAVEALNLAQYDEDYFPSELKPLMDSFTEVMDTIKNIVEGVKVLNQQLKALKKLQPTTDQPVLVTWSVRRISKDVSKLYKEINKECEILQIAKENMAHCRDERLISVYVATWRPGVPTESQLYAYLFSEAGLGSV